MLRQQIMDSPSPNLRFPINLNYLARLSKLVPALASEDKTLQPTTSLHGYRPSCVLDDYATTNFHQELVQEPDQELASQLCWQLTK